MSEPTAISAVAKQADLAAQARAKQQQREAGIRAQAFGEGRKAERSDILKAAGAQTLEDLSMLAALKEQHATEFDRTVKVVAKGAKREGILIGSVVGAALVAALCFGMWMLLKEVVVTNVSTARVALPNDGVPELTYEPNSNTDYERNPREPGTAPR